MKLPNNNGSHSISNETNVSDWIKHTKSIEFVIKNIIRRTMY